MLSASVIREEVEVIMDLIAQSKIDEARERIQRLAPQVSSDYGRGALLAVSGIISMLTKPKGGDSTQDVEKMTRMLEGIVKTQTTDDLDKGYTQTLSKWVKKVRTTEPSNGSQE